MFQPSELPVPALASHRQQRALRSLQISAVYLILASLLAFTLRGVPLAQIWNSLKQLATWQIGLLLLINALVVICMTARWWFIVRAEKPGLPFLPMIGCRLAVFSLSYFTPGPQVGGEPLQILYLRRDYGLTLARAVSTVIIDKLLEFFGNFVFIGIGIFAVIRAGILPVGAGIPTLAWIAILILVLWPPAHILLLSRSRHPISHLLRLVFSRFERQKWFRLSIVSEHLAGTFIHRHPAALFAALTASLLAWTGMAAEYFLMLSFLNIHLQLWQALAALTASLLAFLLPLPGGLGALEASQVLALGSFGFAAATAIGLALLMRTRDLLIGGLGLFFASRGSGK